MRNIYIFSIERLRQLGLQSHPGLKVKAKPTLSPSPISVAYPDLSLKRILLCLLQNGYPSRRRSLVDDARFETLVVKQTKQTVLEEARNKANGKYFLLSQQVGVKILYKVSVKGAWIWPLIGEIFYWQESLKKYLK